jgi:hypothetical protein
MSEYMFGLGKGFLPKKADKIAAKHGAWLINYDDPAEGKRHWFAKRNQGDPFDGAIAKAVLQDLKTAGIIS